MIQGPKDYFKIGDHNAWCDRCGFKFKASELRREWQGFMVCASCYEPRNPQDLLKARPEKSIPPFVRPRNDGPSSDIPGDWEQTDDQAGGSPSFTTYGPVDKDSL